MDQVNCNGETAEEAIIVEEAIGEAVTGALRKVDLVGRGIMRRMFEESAEDCHRKADIIRWRD